MVDKLTLRWLGVAGIELTIQGETLLIDPYLTRIRFWNQWFGRITPDKELISSTLRRGDHVLVTHAHWDHLMDVPEIIRNTNAAALGSENTVELLQLLGVPKDNLRIIHAGDQIDLGVYKIEVIASEHAAAPFFSPGKLRSDLKPPLKAREYRMDACYCFSITANGVRILTDPGQNPGRLPQADILWISPRYAERIYRKVLEQVTPSLVIPIHWDEMWRPLSMPIRPMFKPPAMAIPPLQRMDLKGFREMIQHIDPNGRVFIPDVLVEYDFPERVPQEKTG